MTSGPIAPEQSNGHAFARPDGRAERIRAAAEADRLRAESEAIRARTEAETSARLHREAQQARTDALTHRQAIAAGRAARRRAAVVALADTLRSAVQGLPSVAGFVACVAPTIIATSGQYAFAVEAMKLGALAGLFPAMLEGGAWLLAWKRHQGVRAGQPVRQLTIGVWSLALVAAALNVWHGTSNVGLEVGVAFGLASLVGFGLVELLAGHTRAARRAARTKRSRIGLLRAVRYPGLAWAAWSRRVEIGPGADAHAVWTQAWVDHYGVTPGATARERRAGRRRVVEANKQIDRGTYEPGEDEEDEDQPAGLSNAEIATMLAQDIAANRGLPSQAALIRMAAPCGSTRAARLLREAADAANLPVKELQALRRKLAAAAGEDESDA